jgi:D-alanyl-D-alanine carboxypeptidase/D-alanyl-D-alanine-endopeptidase (penicillin-binding protein 4)
MTRTYVLGMVAVSALLCGSVWGQSNAGGAPALTLARTMGDAAGLQERLRAMVGDPAVSRAHWGVMVTALDGTPIASINEGQLFQPASNAKLYTTAAAMALLGTDATFQTRVYGRGTWDGTTKLKGDLFLVGGGDANLNGRDLPYLSPAEKAARKAEGAPTERRDPLARLAELADQVAATGLREVKGDLVGDDTLWPWEPYPPDWSIDDAIWYYGAPVSALTINDNQIDVVVAPGMRAGDPAAVTVTPALPSYYGLDVSGLTTVPKGGFSHVAFDRAIGSRTLRISGTIAVGAEADSEGVAIEDPAEYAALALKFLLEQRGITVTGAARALHRTPTEKQAFQSESTKPLPAMEPVAAGVVKGDSKVHACAECDHPQNDGKRAEQRELAVRVSVPLAEDVVVTNKVSQNQHAEMFLHDLSLALGDRNETPGSGAEGVRVVRQFLTNAGVDPKDVIFYDGSGLSGHDLVSPRATAKLLSYAAHDPNTGEPQPWFAQWKASLPVAGQDGSLASRFKDPPLKGHVYAKTGTLGEARALSGYLDCASGRTVIFSIMVGDFVPGTAEVRDTLDRLVGVIAEAL